MKAIKWVNGFGDVKWQPVLESGESLWTQRDQFGERRRLWAKGDKNGEPVLYRSKKRAERVSDNESHLRFLEKAGQYRLAEEDK